MTESKKNFVARNFLWCRCVAQRCVVMSTLNRSYTLGLVADPLPAESEVARAAVCETTHPTPLLTDACRRLAAWPTLSLL